MEEFAYLVNALLKSKIKGHFYLNNGIKVTNVEPVDDEIFEFTFFIEDDEIEILRCDKYGRIFTFSDRTDDDVLEYDIVKFVKE